LIDSGLPCATFNTIGKSSLHPRFGLDRAEAAIKHFQSKKVPFTWVLGPLSGHGAMEPALKGYGLSCPEEEWIMAMALDKVVNIPGNLPKELEIKRASTSAAVEDFANVLAAATKPPDENIKTIYMDTKEAATAPTSPLRLYVGYVGDKPVAVQEAYSAHGILNFYAMASLSSAAGKGYGAALMIAALREAKKASAYSERSDPGKKPGHLRAAWLQACRTDRDLQLTIRGTHPQGDSALSTMLVSSRLCGLTALGNAATKFPLGSTKYLWKFHLGALSAPSASFAH